MFLLGAVGMGGFGVVETNGVGEQVGVLGSCVVRYPSHLLGHLGWVGWWWLRSVGVGRGHSP